MIDNKPVLIIQQTKHMSPKMTKSAFEMTKRIGKSLGFEAVFVPMGMSAHVDPGAAIVEALVQQTKAINRLAESNQQIVDCFLSATAEEPRKASTTILDLKQD